MIMCMYDEIAVRCITNRHLVKGDFLGQLVRVLEHGPDALILREKDLPEEKYEVLAEQVASLCEAYHTMCILHTYVDVAIRLHVPAIHLPMDALLSMSPQKREKFSVLGASAHSMEDVELAREAGATYVTFSHVFATDCKKGLPPKGLGALRDICARTDLPVYALGGIHRENAVECIKVGAAGVCVMSEAMRW